jgi:hypothetical protein
VEGGRIIVIEVPIVLILCHNHAGCDARLYGGGPMIVDGIQKQVRGSVVVDLIERLVEAVVTVRITDVDYLLLAETESDDVILDGNTRDVLILVVTRVELIIVRID